jgi:hypothetical protein
MNRDQIQPRVPNTISLPPEQRPKGTGYVGFRPAENRKAARRRKAGTAKRKNVGAK